MNSEEKALSREIATSSHSRTDINAPEVVPPQDFWSQAPFVTDRSPPDASDKETVPKHQQEQPHQGQSWAYGQSEFYAPTASPMPPQSTYELANVPEQRQKRFICGLARPTFLLLLLIVLLIIVAAVGGGVGGSIAVQ